MENILYDELRQYINEHHGFNKDLFKSPLYLRLKDEKEKLKQFNNKRVKIKFSCVNDFMSGSGFKIGKFKIEKNEKGEEQFKFYDGLNRSKYNYIDFGLFEGFYAVLIFHKIEEATQEEFKQYVEEQKEKKFKRRYGF